MGVANTGSVGVANTGSVGVANAGSVGVANTGLQMAKTVQVSVRMLLCVCMNNHIYSTLIQDKRKRIR